MHARFMLPALLALVLIAGRAHGVVLFLDLGDTSSGVQGGPLDNTNPELLVLPGRSIVVHLWGVPADDDARVIATLGHDVQISGSASDAITATAYMIDNPIVGAAARWTGTRLLGGLNTSGKLVDDQRAVFVPTSAPFVGGLGSANLAIDPAFDPSSGAVRLGQLEIAIDSQATPGVSAELRLAVSPLLIASATTGSPGDEPVFFGYDQAGPEPASGSGSVSGATSTVADATITVTSFGDSDADGDVDLNDFGALSACFAGPEQASSPGCGHFDHEPDGDIDLADFKVVQTIFSAP